MLGFINVYKPSGITSNAVISSIKKKFKPSKIGHMGTLDPMAEGVLPIAIGNATRMFEYFLHKQKTYIATFEFGYETDTLDAMGEVIKSTGCLPNVDEVKNILSSFIGKNNQMPPKYSAKNVNGKRAYDLARSGIDFELKPKEIEIFEFTYLNNIDNSYTFKITCSSGAYIRSIGRDLGYALGSLATMTKLIRVESSKFNLDNAVSMEDIESANNIQDLLIDVNKVFDFESLMVNDIDSARLKNGMTIDYKKNNGNYFVLNNDILIGVGNLKDNKLKLETHF